MRSGRRCLPCVQTSSSASGGYGSGAAPASATQTMTVTQDASEALDAAVNTGRRLVLRLKVEQKKGSAITWSDDTVDNENLNRKSSKRACRLI